MAEQITAEQPAVAQEEETVTVETTKVEVPVTPGEGEPEPMPEEPPTAQTEEEQPPPEEEDPMQNAGDATAIRNALPEGASAEFILACVEQKLTPRQATALYNVRASIANSRPGGPGLPRTTTKANPVMTGDFVADARAYASENKCSLSEAMKHLHSANPEAHAAWVDAQRTTKR